MLQGCQGFANNSLAIVNHMKGIIMTEKRKRTVATDNHFGEWLLLALEEKGWSQSDLMRAARAKGFTLSKAAISDVISGKRMPGKRLLAAVAGALGRSIEEVYRAANFLPPVTLKDMLINRILHALETLPPDEKEELLEYIELQRRRLERKNKKPPAK